MTSHPNSVQPPRIAVWLINLFAFGEEGESILGDLLEEFSLLATKSGASTARNWYWRQTVKTVPRLAGFAFRDAPWIITASLVIGLFVRELVGHSFEYATIPVVRTYWPLFEHPYNAYVLFNIEHLITFLLTGLIVAFIAREREMVVTATLALIFGAMVVAGSVYAAIRFGLDPTPWRLTCYLIDLFAIIAAGAVIRTHRLAPKPSRLRLNT